jgi:hypothetical protein
MRIKDLKETMRSGRNLRGVERTNALAVIGTEIGEVNRAMNAAQRQVFKGRAPRPTGKFGDGDLSRNLSKQDREIITDAFSKKLQQIGARRETVLALRNFFLGTNRARAGA